MKLGDLKASKGSKHSKKRLGRGHGSGWGRNAGRGDKGYHSRSGSKHRPWVEGGQMPLHRRLPKRGFSNFLFKKEYQIVNISDLDKLEEGIVDADILKLNGIVKYSLRPIKILGDGELSKKLDVTASAFSGSAREKITKAGGKVTEQ